MLNRAINGQLNYRKYKADEKAYNIYKQRGIGSAKKDKNLILVEKNKNKKALLQNICRNKVDIKYLRQQAACKVQHKLEKV